MGSDRVNAWRDGWRALSGGVGRGLRAFPFLSVHLGCLAAYFTGVDRVALWMCVVSYLVRMFGITAGYHRYFSHRSYKTSRSFQFVLAFLGCSALQKGPLWWAAHHRDHHRHSDMPQDPHSPILNSLWWAHVGWIIASDHDETRGRRVADLARFSELRWLDRNHWIPGLTLATACYFIAGSTGLVWGFFVSTVLCYHATFALNSLGHRVGSRRYETDDESRNNLALALLTLGEGWHNNHHFYASSANQGFFWWEIDITYYLIKVLERAGLVWEVRNPPPAMILGRSWPSSRPAAAKPTSGTTPPDGGHLSSSVQNPCESRFVSSTQGIRQRGGLTC
jgi:stearoyl-CoA desaturase (delta-9 desaturase)